MRTTTVTETETRLLTAARELAAEHPGAHGLRVGFVRTDGVVCLMPMIGTSRGVCRDVPAQPWDDVPGSLTLLADRVARAFAAELGAYADFTQDFDGDWHYFALRWEL